MIRNANENFKFKKAYYSFSPKKNYKIIVLDDIITDEITSNGYIDAEQMKWLKKELDSSKNDVVLIYMHVPIIEPFASPNHKLRNAYAVKELIEGYKNPIGVFQGHYHAAKITQHDNVTCLIICFKNLFNHNLQFVNDDIFENTRNKVEIYSSIKSSPIPTIPVPASKIIKCPPTLTSTHEVFPPNL